MPFVSVSAARIEYERISVAGGGEPPIVMLHEGLGSVAMWKDLPERIARFVGRDVLVYSRPGYGRSSPIVLPRPFRYLHDEALTILPQLLEALDIRNPVLFGHSDGASIALIHAGASGRDVAGLILLAPHVMVEDITVQSIAAARRAYLTGDLRMRLARYHDDVDGAFRGWNDTWLNPGFRSWNIEDVLPRIACPILAVQGEDDEYATMAQLDRIEQGAPCVETLKLRQCGHSPQRDRPETLLEATRAFIERLETQKAGRCGRPSSSPAA